MTYNILIIGAGQLGSRHMQGVLRSCNEINLYLLDPSQDSLKVAELRSKEIEHNHNIYFTNNWNSLPKFFEIVIVSTNSNIREKVVFNLLTEFKVKYLILEKVLFQEIDSFQRITKLIESSKVKVWVNHPRRLYKSYNQFIKENDLSSIKVFSLVGWDWGLACNGLHFLDLISFISNSEVIDIDVNSLDNKLLHSKRIGFVEFSGTISGRLSNDSVFNISSFTGDNEAPTMILSGKNTTYIIKETGKSRIFEINSANSTGVIELQKFNVEFQSDLTNLVVDELIERGECNLTQYECAFKLHKLFLNALLLKYNQINNSNSKILPIT